ncbi:hypothetical protein BD289DRAFT_360320 [Coniella lustricola]|uniref:RING-type E3 ubiquitin transferase n=1 Tax=Coniella lustricola TaxID=2025994 RepID=A0A2T3AK89_9PEZI|nr:hypothetical protein BD289DRAFT_360320 [Coniella lustricola]
MFTSPAPAPTSSLSPGVLSLATANPASSATHPHPHSHAHAHANTPADGPPSSTSRTRRGLSYLRNYTQNHLLSRDHSNHASSPTSPTSSSAFRSAPGLTRSASDNTASTAPANHSASATDSERSNTRSHRLTLVANWAHPLSPSSPILDGLQDHIPPPPLPPPPPPSASQSLPRAMPPPGTAITTTTETQQEPTPAPRRSMTRSRSATTGSVMAASSSNNRADDGNGLTGILPSIRFSVFVDPRSSRPSLHFSPVARTLPTGQEVIRVGRYSERDSQPAVPTNVPSSAPVGFKSKVVSRRHCEFWYEDGKWYIKDVKSSSGTFLNHIRLSPPGQESKPFPVNDGDVVQLGIDFKGGEEMIFRCVKMRLELNRGWQNKLNKFNMSSHKRLWNMTKSEGSGKDYSQDCSICLNSIAPCQCLFVAPCSHTWHFKCIRALLSGPNYPIFICPNCRAAADLEAEVEDPEDWEEMNGELQGKDNASVDESKSKEPRLDPPAQVEAGRASMDRIRSSLERARATAAERARTSMDRQRPAMPTTISALEETPGPSASASMDNVAMTDTAPSTSGIAGGNGHEGPITPRNDAGPWVFDGSGARIAAAAAAAAAPAPAAGVRQSLNGMVEGMDVDS